jgi:C_GCAxxG_C_C family probable redox protein
MDKMRSPDGITLPVAIRKWNYRKRSLANLLRMGHCAPSVMKTLLQICDADEEWAVKLAAGLPGGVGDTGFECGGITSPLLALGLLCGLEDGGEGLPLVFHIGHAHLRGFLDRNGSPHCREIRGDPYRLRKCIKAVCFAPEIALRAAAEDGRGAIGDESREAYALLYSHLTGRNFHCARAVLERVGAEIPQRSELRDAVSGFMGGTLFKGMTCSAMAAGVMALGFELRRFENSLPRVMRMIILMKTGGDAFADRINAFNRIMSRGNALAGWFAGEFGSTQCRSITGCDFSSVPDVRRYIATDSIDKCIAISEKVAERVRGMIQDAAPPSN